MKKLSGRDSYDLAGCTAPMGHYHHCYGRLVAFVSVVNPRIEMLLIGVYGSAAEEIFTPCNSETLKCRNQRFSICTLLQPAKTEFSFISFAALVERRWKEGPSYGLECRG